MAVGCWLYEQLIAKSQQPGKLLNAAPLSWSNKARKQLLKLSRQDASKIHREASVLAYFPECQSIKKLINHQYDYRLRVGRYRIFFNFDGGIHIVTIEEVKLRNEHTY
ncbi:type II toxin-antitoxin system RelE family toxin [Endozoicomonas euniceicola]|uniref:Type II toxin-antitoxin system RelE/ParE family toxin n=1 Tax=Endozoicomonas euniceicola TaxID=1234143 RepID=A0ABY6H365_9GAMM|nr:type II toxin-antitoxin system RelE/ParE family toxin [Endozoicomonas euniceicola]UYM18673.1 type II toxin-antitoxin system RelE/ParE family toxin [Endozoicomonas euniceicola]